MRFLNLDPNLCEPFEIGALMIAALAFPGKNEEDAMRRATVAWCADQIAKTMAAEPSSDAADLFPHYAKADAKDVRRAIRTVTRRLRDRFVAARMARGFLNEATYGAPAKLPDKMERLSLNQLCLLVLHESGQSEPENVEKRTWRPSLPIIHLASAFSLMGEMSDVSEIIYDFQDLDQHREIVASALKHEEMVLADNRFGVKPENLIRLRWVE
uniref:hypothetical protein n=1 Tax=Sphingomonas sp. TaxID=28214 RepID=UPI0025E94A60|nr:hypothetical protein [Sphingomonas sp.]